MNASPLILKLREKPQAGLDMSPLLPEKLQTKKQSQIANIKLDYGVDKINLGDIFSIQNRANGNMLQIKGGSGHFHSLGMGLKSGSIEVFGGVGDDCGLNMQGGNIRVRGNSGNYTASGMLGGHIIIDGDSGDDCAAMRPGGTSGIAGGMLHIGGACGDRLGATMSGGMVVVAGKAGSDLGVDIKAGTILALSGCVAGHSLGMARGMRRGTLIINQPGLRLAPTFAKNGTFELAAMRVVMQHIAESSKNLRFLAKCSMLVHRYSGDRSVGGVGEILVPVRDFHA